ncbi:MAG: DUF1616 domain-containing protein [Dehalococcoidales bacterium]|nr:DUF1616 domain-containing protein [Dehalococcoidales bacterium]
MNVILNKKEYNIAFNIHLNQRTKRSAINKVLLSLLAVMIVGTIGAITYTFINPKTHDAFTEFYMLGNVGKDDYYIGQLQVNETGQVTVGIVNHEQAEASYRIEVTIDDAASASVGSIVLQDNEKWEGTVSFTPLKAGNNEKVEFFLYRDSGTEPYLQPLRLWINVSQ